MTKSELILAISSRFPHLSNTDASLTIQTILNGMADQLSNGRRIEIRGFGSFAINTRPARVARNPKTGEKVQVLAKHVPHFKPGIDLKKRVQDGLSSHSEAVATGIKVKN